MFYCLDVEGSMLKERQAWSFRPGGPHGAWAAVLEGGTANVVADRGRRVVIFEAALREGEQEIRRIGRELYATSRAHVSFEERYSDLE